MWFLFPKLFSSCLNLVLRPVCFPVNGKKANVVPVHKKGDRKTLKNYRPISLLPICGKIFERLIHVTCMNFSLKIAGSHQNQFG